MPRAAAKVTQAAESEVQATCRAILQAHGCRVERRNTGTMRVVDERTGKIRYVKFGEEGAADLFGELPNGRAYNLEVKREGEKPRLEQVRWLRAANRWAPAFWVDDAGTLLKVLPALIDGAIVEYLPDKWRFRIELDLPGGKKTKDWLWEAGGDYEIGWPTRRG